MTYPCAEQRHQLRKLTSRLKTLAGTDLHDALAGAVNEGLGEWRTPDNCGRWKATANVEIRLFGIIAQGATDEEAVRNWMKVAGVALTSEGAGHV